VPREHDTELAGVVRAAAGGRSGIAVLVGGSSTGKTRACWEALGLLRGQDPPWRLWHPIDPSRPDAMLAELPRIGPRTVVWLNEAQFYLDVPEPGLGERVAAGLRELLRDPARAPVLALATLWPRFWDVLTARPDGGADPHAQARELLAGRDITVPAAFTPAQMGQVARAADVRLVLAARSAPDGEVIQFLAGAPELLARYRNAPPAARALISAAMDARRLGTGPATCVAGVRRRDGPQRRADPGEVSQRASLGSTADGGRAWPGLLPPEAHDSQDGTRVASQARGVSCLLSAPAGRMTACTLMIPSLISWTASPLLSTPMTLMASQPWLPTTSSSSPPHHHPTAYATKAGTRCARSGERCWRRRPRPGFPSRSSSRTAQDAPSCAGATTGRTDTCVAWILSGSEMASSPKAWPTSRASATPQQTGAPGRPRLVPRVRLTVAMVMMTGRRVLGATEQPSGAAPMAPRQAETDAL